MKKNLCCYHDYLFKGVLGVSLGMVSTLSFATDSDGTWSGGTNSEYTNPANWQGNLVAGNMSGSASSSVAVFNAVTNMAVLIGSGDDIGLGQMDFGSSADYTVTIAGNLTLSGVDGAALAGAVVGGQQFTINTGGSLQVSSGSLYGNAFTNSGTITLGNGALADGSSFDNYGTITLQDGATLGPTAVAATIINEVGGSVFFQGADASIAAITNYGTFDISYTASNPFTVGVDVLDDSSTSSGLIKLGANTLEIYSTSSIYGVISGTGNLYIPKEGNLFLYGINTYTGLTTAESSTIQLGDSTHQTATIAGDIEADAGSFLIYGIVSGTTTIDVSGSVTLGDTGSTPMGTLNGDVTVDYLGTLTSYGTINAAINNSGQIAFYSSNANGNAITNNTQGVITYYDSSDAGDITITNNGSIFFEDTSTAANTTVINNATFDISGLTGTSPAITFASIQEMLSSTLFLGNSQLVITGDGSVLYGVTGDTNGSLYFNAATSSDTLLLAGGTMTYGGVTRVSTGTLEIGNLSVSPLVTGDVAVDSSGTLAVYGTVMGSVTASGNSTINTAAFSNLKGLVTIDPGSTLTSYGFLTDTLANSGTTYFYTTSSISSLTIDNGVTGGGTLIFENAANATDMTITNGGYGYDSTITFDAGSSTSTAVITNNVGSTIYITGAETGSATITNYGIFDISATSIGPFTASIGSITDSAVIPQTASILLGANTLELSDGSSTVYSAITDAGLGGSIIVTGINTDVQLNGINTYSGLTTVSNNGTLQIGSSTYTSAQIAGDLLVSGGNALLYGTVLQSVTVDSGANLQIGDTSSAIGNIGGSLMNQGATEIYTNITPTSITTPGYLSYAQSATVSDITITNTGNIDFSDTSSAGGSLINNSGNSSVTFNDSSTAGSATLNLSNYATISFTDTSNAGSAVINVDADEMTMTAAFALSAGASAGSAIITLNNNALGAIAAIAYPTTAANQATFILNSGSDLDLSALSIEGFSATYIEIGSVSGAGSIALGSFELETGYLNYDEAISGVISDGGIGCNFFQVNCTGGSLNKQGTGTLTLNNVDTYTGATTVSDGTLQIGDATHTGTAASISSATISIAAGTTLSVWGQTYTSTGANTLSNSGELDFYGDASSAAYTAVTNNSGAELTIDNATSAVTIGNIAGVGVIALGNNELIVGTLNQNGVFNGVIRDPVFNITQNTGGSLTKVGTGTLVLNGVNTYSGTTTVNNGLLQIGDNAHPTASISGPTRVNAPGMLTGYGIIGNNLTNDGTVTPGGNNTPGNLTVQGNYSQSAAGTYVTTFESANNTFNTLMVTDTAALDGNITVIVNSGININQTYTLLSAGAVSGTFSSMTIPMFLQGDIAYTPTMVQLNVKYNMENILAAAQTPNQIAVALNIIDTGANTAINDALLQATNVEQFDALLDQLSGATYANQQFSIAAAGQSFENELAYRLDKDRECWTEIEDGMESLPICTNKDAWLKIYSGSNQWLNTFEVSGLNSDTYGVAVGAEMAVYDNAVLGFALSYSHLHDTATAIEIATMRGQLYQAALYGRYDYDDWRLGIALDYGITDTLSASRNIENTLNGTAQTHGYYKSALLGGQLRASYGWAAQEFITIRPTTAFIYQRVPKLAFSEDTQTGFELDVQSHPYQSSRSQLGIAFNSDLLSNLQPILYVAWEHEFSTRKVSFDANFLGLTESFLIEGTAVGADSIYIQAGLTLITLKGVDIALDYQGRFVKNFNQNTIGFEMGFF